MIPSYLEGFSKRMTLVAEISSVIARINKNSELEALIGPENMCNIIFSVLIHIMERTLTENVKCTLDDIEDFIAEIMPSYSISVYRVDVRELTRYIIKDILQCKGQSYNFKIMDYGSGMQSMSVRLIRDIADDNGNISYVLDQQGFDLLFRTKEVDELGFQIEEIRLEKLIKRGNYSEALEQSRQIIRMINEKKIELDLFEKSMRYNISCISGEEYDQMCRSINNMLCDEYDTMNEIYRTVHLAIDHFNEKMRYSETLSDELQKDRRHIYDIEKNIGSILCSQRELLAKNNRLSGLYSVILKEALISHRSHHFDFEKEILRPLERYSGNGSELNDIRKKLLMPLMLVQLPYVLDINLFYSQQQFREETVGDEAENMEEYDDNSEAEKYIENRNKSHVTVIRLLLEYSALNPQGFDLEALWNYACEKYDVGLLSQNKLFFLVMLKLFEQQTIDIPEWRQESVKIHECSGEFDLSYCLYQISVERSDMYGIKQITVNKGGTLADFEFEDTKSSDELKCRYTFQTDNLQFSPEVNNDARVDKVNAGIDFKGKYQR